MPLEQEFSMVADSTVSLSPGQATDASVSVIKRATRTYGKRREQPLVEESASSSSCAISHFENIHRTAPPGLNEMVPASSPAKLDTDDVQTNSCQISPHEPRQKHSGFSNDSDSECNGVQSRYMFDWKRELDELDETDDDSPGPTLGSKQKPPRHGEEYDKVIDQPRGSLFFGNTMLLQGKKEDTICSGTTSITATTSHSVSDDVFEGPSSSPSGPNPSQSSFIPSSPPMAAPRHRPTRVIQDTDSEEEPQKDSSSTAPSTSAPRLFISPKSRSSSTQPTSDDDMPAKVSTVPKVPNRKQKLSRTSVPPLDFTELSSNDSRKGRKGKNVKLKAPTKKELRETAKERGRLAAQATATVPRADMPSKYTMENLFRVVSGQPNPSQSSDPIEPFTSSPACESYQSNEVPHVRSPSPLHVPIAELEVGSIPDRGDSGDELPEVEELLREDAAKRGIALKRMKRRALELQESRVESHEAEDEDDLVISADPKATVKEEEEHRRSKQSRPSNTRKKVAQMAHVGLAKKAKKATVISPDRNRKDFTSLVHNSLPTGSNTDLNGIIFARAKEQGSCEIKRKEEEWTKHGGHPAQRLPATAQGFDSVMKAIAGKGLEAVKVRRSDIERGSSDSGKEDEDWRPDFGGSASPKHQIDGVETDDSMAIDGDTTMVAEVNMNSSDNDNAKGHKSWRNIVNSDSEDDGSVGDVPTKTAEPIARRFSTSSELATEDECDKENDTKLMYDQGEDKENKRVARYSPVSKSRTIFDLTDRGGELSSPEPLSRSQGFDDENSGGRRPFQDLLSEGSPRAQLFSPSNLTQPFASKLQQAEPLPSTLEPAATFNAFLNTSAGFGGFSQFSQEVSGAVSLQPGFSELFEPGIKNGKPPTTPNVTVSWPLKRADTLDLTQDVAAAIQLQPAFQAEESLMRKADTIFEKEQAFVVEANMKKLTRQKTELFVNEMGFLTQTKPLDRTPEVYHRASPVRGALSVLSPSEFRTQLPSQRIPLQTISLSGPSQFDSPKQNCLRRLRRADDTLPRVEQRSPITSPPVRQPRQLDANAVLRHAQEFEWRKEKIRRNRAEHDVFFEDEAAESDDDGFFGFAAKKPADDEEEGENLDQNLPGLVDDCTMDAKTEAAELVLDKYKEHLEEDDKKLEELHQAAVQGQLRQKRGRGVGIDDSDDDSDTDNGRAWRILKKARKSDRTDIKGLEASEETRAFADSYNQCLRDNEEEDFAYLNKDVPMSDILTDNIANDRDNVEDEDEDQMPVETIEVGELRKTIQEEARHSRLTEVVPMDLADVSWVESNEDVEEAPRVKSITTRQRPKLRPDAETLEFDGTMGPVFRKGSDLNESTKKWYAQESRLRNTGTARSGVRSAVTGHAKAKPKAGVMAVSSTQKAQSSGAMVRPVRSAASAVSIIVDKSSNFG